MKAKDFEEIEQFDPDKDIIFPLPGPQKVSKKKRPKCKSCKTILVKVYIRNGGYRNHLKGHYYCKFCDKIIKREEER